MQRKAQSKSLQKLGCDCSRTSHFLQTQSPKIFYSIYSVEDFLLLMKANLEQIAAFLKQEFPQSLEKCQLVDVAEKYAKVSYRVGMDELRPGGTVSGPTMFTIADFALYVAILADIGIVALAVTANLNIHFLRKPASDQDLWAECRLLKVGKTLAVGEVWVYSQGQEEPVAHVTGSYALPIQS